MNFVRVRNFERYQHYADRRPPWIKLYRDLWDDPRFFSLSDAERYALIGIFVIASQQDNKVPTDTKWLQAKLLTKARIPLEKLIATGWLEPVEQDASNTLAASTPLAERYPSRAGGETEVQKYRDTEREIEKLAFGEFASVRLSQIEHEKLTLKLNGNLEAYINRLDRYSQKDPVKFRKYKSHYAVILDWFDTDLKAGKVSGNQPALGKPSEEEIERQRVAMFGARKTQ